MKRGSHQTRSPWIPVRLKYWLYWQGCGCRSGEASTEIGARPPGAELFKHGLRVEQELETVVTSTALQKRAAQDRCPGVLVLHEAADGWLARVRVPGGRLSATKLRALAAAAEQLGSGLIDITARANLQLRGLEQASAPELAERLRRAELLPSWQHDRARNVLAGPLAGRSRAALDDVDELVALLDSRICDAPALSALSGRFCFLVDDGSGAGWEVGPDVTISARGAGRFSVLLDGQPLGFEGDAAAAAELATRAAEAFLEMRGEERAWRLAEVAGGARAVAERLGLGLGARRPARPASAVGPGVALQRDGRSAVTALTPLGQLWPGLLRELAALCELADTDVRISPQRTITVVDLDADAVTATSAALQRAGLELDAASGWVGLTACAGVGACANALADVRAAAALRARTRSAGAPTEHWTACGRRCGEGSATAVAVAVEAPGRVAIRHDTRAWTEPTLDAARDRLDTEAVR